MGNRQYPNNLDSVTPKYGDLFIFFDGNSPYAQKDVTFADLILAFGLTTTSTSTSTSTTSTSTSTSTSTTTTP